MLAPNQISVCWSVLWTAFLGRGGWQVDSRCGQTKGGDQLPSHQGQMGPEQVKEWGRCAQGNVTFVFIFCYFIKI